MNPSNKTSFRKIWFIVIPVVGIFLLAMGIVIGVVVSPSLSTYLPSIVNGDDFKSSAFFQNSSSAGIPSFWKPVLGEGEGVTKSIGSEAHKGVDEFAIDYSYPQEGMDIYPTLPGKVVYSGCRDDYGCSVVIRHWDDGKWDKKYYSIYVHLQPDGWRPYGL